VRLVNGSTSVNGGPPDALERLAAALAAGRNGGAAADPATGDEAWSRQAARVAAWMLRGGYPDALREDLVRDVVALWEELPPDDPAWDAAAVALATLADLRRAAERDACSRAAIPACSGPLGAVHEHVAGRAAPALVRERLEQLLAALDGAEASS
jgi:hypothetical protein